MVSVIHANRGADGHRGPPFPPKATAGPKRSSQAFSQERGGAGARRGAASTGC